MSVFQLRHDLVEFRLQALALRHDPVHFVVRKELDSVSRALTRIASAAERYAVVHVHTQATAHREVAAFGLRKPKVIELELRHSLAALAASPVECVAQSSAEFTHVVSFDGRLAFVVLGNDHVRFGVEDQSFFPR